MLLKRLDIKGFKSFADNTEIILNPGINIVVGPNGCGKSNIVDAIRWVLGEANVRHLRGQKSEDVIFNGSDKKRALGMAAVELTIDNHDNSLPLDFNEITLGRKIFRSGESEFYLNKSRVRMKDITELLSGTGMGKKGYSIIGQGELEQVLNGQSLDRRLILEEAAGIIKYRQQRDEVKKRITNTGNDLLRLGDILEEIRIRRGEVFHKSEKAKLHVQLSDECQVLERKVMGFELIRTEKELYQKRNDLTLQQKELAELLGQIDSWEKLLQQEEEELDEQQTSLSSLMEDKHRNESRLNVLQGEIRLCEERIRNNRERIGIADIDENKYLGLLENIERDLGNCFADYNAEQEDVNRRTVECEQLQSEVQQMDSAIRNFQNDFEIKKGSVFDKIKQESEIKNEIREKEELLKKNRERTERAAIRLEELGGKINKGHRSRAELEKKKSEHNEKMKEIEVLLEDYVGEMKQQEEILQELNKYFRELNQKSMEINNSLLAIRDMQKNLAGYSPGVKSVLNSAGRNQLKGILGLMGEIIDVPAGMELAVDVAAGNGLQNIVADRIDHAREAIKFLKKHNIGRVTFLPLDLLKVQNVPPALEKEMLNKEGVLGLASRLVKYDNKFTKAVEYLLGRVLLVNDMESGIRLFKTIHYPLRIVSLDGELINVSGAITGGNKASSGSTPLQRRGEEKKLILKGEENRLAREENRHQARNIEIRKEELEQKISLTKKNLMENRFSLEMLTKQEEELRLDMADWEQERHTHIIQSKQYNEESNDLDKAIGELHTALANMQKDNQIVTLELEQLKEENEVVKRDYEVRKERLLSYQDQLDMKKRELDNIQKNVKQFEQVKLSYQQSYEKACSLKQDLDKEIELEQSKIEQINHEIEEKKTTLEQLVQLKQDLQTGENAHRENVASLRQELIPARQKLAQLENQIRNLEIAGTRIEVEMEGQSAKWQEKFGTLPGDCPEEQYSAGQIRDFKKKIEILQQELESIGAVDIESIREYTEISERYEFINQQYEDLSSARNSLDALLKETEKLMLKKFSQFMMLAAESFRKTFKEMFGGGEAELKLEAEADRLEAGVNIEVKMPGKRTQSLSLLSGGERALTCIAFIFSLLRLKPIPFCLLDEIDASLDEINLQRFSQFIKEISKDIQFIVITHRQATIESGENIYGITMPEEGASSVYTLNVLEAETLAG